MARFDHIVRVVRLVERLGERASGLTLQTIADELGVHERTARRYLDALERGGYPLEREGGRFRLPRSRAGVRLTAEDKRRLLMAALVAGPLRGTPFAPTVGEVHRQLDEGPAQQDLFARLQLPLAVPGRLGIDYTAHEANLRTLLKGLDERHVVSAVYFSAGRGEETRRDLDPYSFYFDPTLETLYLFAWCHTRRAVRTFAAHRFRGTHLTRRVFTVDPSFSAERHLAGAFRVYRGTQATEVAIRFTAAVAPRVRERSFHASQRRQDLPGGAVELRFDVDGLEELVPFVLSYGADALVIEPPALAERVAAALRAAAAQYPQPASAAQAGEIVGARRNLRVRPGE